MNDKTVTKIAVYGMLGLVLGPAVIMPGSRLIVRPIANGITNAVHKAKTKRGLKEEGIIDIDRRDYEVIVD